MVSTRYEDLNVKKPKHQITRLACSQVIHQLVVARVHIVLQFEV